MSDMAVRAYGSSTRTAARPVRRPVAHGVQPTVIRPVRPGREIGRASKVASCAVSGARVVPAAASVWRVASLVGIGALFALSIVVVVAAFLGFSDAPLTLGAVATLR